MHKIALIPGAPSKLQWQTVLNERKTDFISLVVTCCFLCFPLAGPAQENEAQSTEAAADRLELDPLVIVASKSPRPLSEVAAQVTVIDFEDIKQGMVEDLEGLFK